MVAPASAASAGPPQSEPGRAYYRAAAQGSADAQASLAECYAKGLDVEQSDTAAFQWFMRAAGQGHAKAQLKLAEIWANGKGVPRNDLLAYKWAYLAAQNASEGNTRDSAEKLLGTLAKNLSTAEIGEARAYASQWKAQVESSPASPAETVAKGDTGAKPQPREATRPSARKRYGSPAEGRRMRHGGSGQARAIRARLSTIARQLGF